MKQKKDTRSFGCVNLVSTNKTLTKNKQLNYNKKVVKKQYKIDFFKILVVINFFICGAVLIHDFVFWGIVPMFNGEFYQITYLGLFIDFGALMMVDLSIQLIKDWLK